MNGIIMRWWYVGVLLLLTGCSGPSSRQNEFNAWIVDNGKVKVLSTTGMINDLVKRIGGSHVDAITLIQGELDPHSYQLVKGDDEKLRYAQIIFYSGLGLEHGPSLQHYLADNPKGVSMGGAIQEQDPQAVVYVNGQQDPHIWMDISLWAKAVPTIVKALSAKAPDYAAEFEKNGEALQAEMARIHEEVKALLHALPEEQRYLVTSHDAFNYFTRAYLSEPGETESGEWTKRFAAPEGLAPESQLSTSHVKAIIEHLKQYQIHLIFPESNVSRDSIRKIVQAGKEQGLDVRIACCPLYGDAMGPAGSDGDTYLKMIVHNAHMLASHMAHPDEKHK